MLQTAAHELTDFPFKVCWQEKQREKCIGICERVNKPACDALLYRALHKRHSSLPRAVYLVRRCAINRIPITSRTKYDVIK